MESRIEREAGIGIGEQLEEARRLKEMLEHEVVRFVHELAVLDLLHKTLVDAEREAKERYMAPVVQRVILYLQRLFPNATIRCDENFIVTGVLRAAEENFDGLSDGTQEQVAILTRLAFAGILIDSNRPAMLILDDLPRGSKHHWIPLALQSSHVLFLARYGWCINQGYSRGRWA